MYHDNHGNKSQTKLIFPGIAGSVEGWERVDELGWELEEMEERQENMAEVRKGNWSKIFPTLSTGSGQETIGRFLICVNCLSLSVWRGCCVHPMPLSLWLRSDVCVRAGNPREEWGRFLVSSLGLTELTLKVRANGSSPYILILSNSLSLEGIF